MSKPGEKKGHMAFHHLYSLLRFPSVKGFDGLLFNRFPSKQDEISDQFRGEYMIEKHEKLVGG